MSPTVNFTLHAILATALAAFATASAAAAEAAYLKFDVDGGTTGASSDKPRIAVIEAQGQAPRSGKFERQIQVESWSFGATNAGSHAGGGGGGAGKVNVHDISVTKSVEREMKESGEKGGTEDINIGVGELQEVTISKSMDSSSPSPAKDKPMAWNNTTQKKWAGRPLDKGSLSVKVPAGACRVGARYPTAELGTDKGIYRMTDVVVTGCAPAASGDRPMESLSLNYTKISF